ncbi:MAG: ATP-dependent DNA helicase RecG, partial [Thermoanaerobaculia bacterium]
EGTRWFRSPVAWRFDEEKVRQLTALRRAEQARMQEYMRTSTCLMRFLATELDDPYAARCGRCANCAGPFVDETIDQQLVTQAAEFLRRTRVIIEPRKLWPVEALPQFGFKGKIAGDAMEPGRALSIWGDGGWAELVRKGKYEDGRFDDELVAACATLIKDWSPSPRPSWVTCIPSRNHPSLVPDFARRLAGRLGLPFHAAIEKVRDNAPQKAMENSVQQARNLDGVFRAGPGQVKSGAVLLIDDIADSRWTLTVAGALLKRAGCAAVFPLVLADSSHA